jgi:hypothetical protein
MIKSDKLSPFLGYLASKGIMRTDIVLNIYIRKKSNYTRRKEHRKYNHCDYTGTLIKTLKKL